jgi:hypothetical protein
VARTRASCTASRRCEHVLDDREDWIGEIVATGAGLDMQRLLIAIAALLPAACLPPAEDAGEVDPTGSSGGPEDDGTPGSGEGDESSESGGLPAEVDIDWTLEIEPDLAIFRLLRTTDGVLVALQGDPSAPEPYAEVREYTSDMTLAWSQPLPNATIVDLEDLGGGEYLAAGVSEVSGSSEPTLWRVSCCAEVASQTYPHPSQYGDVSVELRGSEILLMVLERMGSLSIDEVTFLQIPLELGPATDLGMEYMTLKHAARTASDSVLLLVEAGDADMLSDYGPEGYTGGDGVGTRMALVGKGDELTVMSLLEDEVEIQPFGGGDEWVSVSIPGFAAYYDGFTVDRHERVVLVHMEYEDDGSSSHLVEFDDAGVVVRSFTVPHVQYDYSSAELIAVGEDDAIYLGVGESTPGVGRAQYLHRIAPL